MRQILVVIVFSLGLSFSSCNLFNPCADKMCANGTCNNGNCDCFAGYSQDGGGACTVKWVDNFKGAWSVSDDCTPSTYASIISGSGTSMRLQNFADDYGYIQVSVTSANTFKIFSSEVFSPSTGRRNYIESVGEGVLNAAGTEITLTYKVTDLQTNTITTCSSTWTR